MKIAVLGASGGSGIAFVKAGLKAGHHITAGVHSNNSLADHHNLTVITCDATDISNVITLVTGHDAVVSLLGHGKKSPANMQTDAMQNVIQAMQDNGVKRLITLTGTGVRFPGDKITIIDRVLNLGVSTVDPERVKDGIRQTRLVQNSNLDWTILRVLKLQNTKPKPYVLRNDGPAKIIVSREEVAQAILELLEDQSFIQQAPMVSNA